MCMKWVKEHIKHWTNSTFSINKLNNNINNNKLSCNKLNNNNYNNLIKVSNHNNNRFNRCNNIINRIKHKVNKDWNRTICSNKVVSNSNNNNNICRSKWLIHKIWSQVIRLHNVNNTIRRCHRIIQMSHCFKPIILISHLELWMGKLSTWEWVRVQTWTSSIITRTTRAHYMACSSICRPSPTAWLICLIWIRLLS